MSPSVRLTRLQPQAIHEPVATPPDAAVMATARRILDEVRAEGEPALRRHAIALDGLAPEAPLVLDRKAMDQALADTNPRTGALLKRTAARIADFARAQRQAVRDLEFPIPGGQAGHRVLPLGTAGCYAPAGRHPLPSSVLMTAVTARAAGVDTVVVASPVASPLMLAAAAVARADLFLVAGGAQAIAAMALGVTVPRADVIVGPGNAWVTAAKLLVADQVRTDGAAGPSELVVVADAAADPALVAADLLAQAEHDPLARVALITLEERLIPQVEKELQRQLQDLPTGETARASLEQAVAVVVENSAEAVRICHILAPEHLQWTADGGRAPEELDRYGGLFCGEDAAEVLGDYGAGPNHVLPTGGQARSRGGLSVLDFLAFRTWLRIDDRRAAAELVQDARDLARLEGLAAHAGAADRRQQQA